MAEPSRTTPSPDPAQVGGQPPAALRPLERSPAGRRWLAALLVFAVTVVVYCNTLGNHFVSWDDRDYVYGNQQVQDKENGLRAIWTDVFAEKPNEQYYPLVFTSYWIEHQFVGLNPALYHATQMVLHGLNAALLVFVLHWLGIGFLPALFAGLLFAVHPVNVASVAWITERKNTLSGLFALLALLLYIQSRRRGGRHRYLLSLVFVQLSLLAKTTALALAPILLATDRLLDRRWTGSSLKRSLPFFLLGFAMACVTMRVEGMQAKGGTPVAPLLRPLVASAALTHYVTKLVVPFDLLPVYPRWPESFGFPRYWISLAAVIAAVLLIWRYRRWLGDRILWGIAVFGLATAPALGLKHFNYMQFSFVADHYVYIGSAGFAVVVGLLLQRLGTQVRLKRTTVPADNLIASTPGIRSSRRVLAGGLALGFVAACSWLTVRQNRVWKDGIAFWEFTLAGNPDCYAGNHNLGNHYARAKQFDQALRRYRAAARLRPQWVSPSLLAARCCVQLQRTDEAGEHFRNAMAASERSNPRDVRVHLDYAQFLSEAQRFDQATQVYERILELHPRHPAATQRLQELRARRGQPGRP